MTPPPDPGMKVRRAVAAFGESEFLSSTVYPQIMRISDSGDRRHCMVAAHNLYASGYLDRACVHVIGAGVSGDEKSRKKQQRKEVKRRRNEAVGQLQTAGFLPAGFGWLLIQWVVVPFITWLIETYVLGDDPESESAKDFARVCG